MTVSNILRNGSLQLVSAKMESVMTSIVATGKSIWYFFRGFNVVSCARGALAS